MFKIVADSITCLKKEILRNSLDISHESRSVRVVKWLASQLRIPLEAEFNSWLYSTLLHLLTFIITLSSSRYDFNVERDVKQHGPVVQN